MWPNKGTKLCKNACEESSWQRLRHKQPPPACLASDPLPSRTHTTGTSCSQDISSHYLKLGTHLRYRQSVANILRASHEWDTQAANKRAAPQVRTRSIPRYAAGVSATSPAVCARQSRLYIEQGGGSVCFYPHPQPHIPSFVVTSYCGLHF